MCEGGSEHLCSNMVMDVSVLLPQESTGQVELGIGWGGCVCVWVSGMGCVCMWE